MGFLDKLKGLASGPAGEIADKLVVAAEQEIMKRVGDLKAGTEAEAKAKFKELSTQVMREKVKEINDPTGMVQKFAEPACASAADKVVEKLWDKVREKIVKPA